MSTGKKKLSLAFWIFLALIIGAGIGWGLVYVPGGAAFATKFIKPIGTIFVNLLKFIVVPIVLFSMVCGMISMKDIKKVGSIGWKTLVYYIGTTIVALIIGLVLANIFKGGFPQLSTEGLGTWDKATSADFMTTLVDIFPSNIVAPFANASMLQIIVIYLGPGLLGMNNPWPSGSGGRMVAAVVAFAINYACYFSEIYRGGIEAVPKGQTEAGQVLGMTKTQIFFKVTLLQVVKRILPPMGNEIITLVKDTSLANTIANKEIIMMAKEYSAKGLIWPLFSTALFFLVFVGALTILFNWAEKKLDYFRC